MADPNPQGKEEKTIQQQIDELRAMIIHQAEQIDKLKRALLRIGGIASTVD